MKLINAREGIYEDEKTGRRYKCLALNDCVYYEERCFECDFSEEVK